MAITIRLKSDCFLSLQNQLVNSLVNFNNGNNSSVGTTEEEMMYEADIANDMRKLELKWQEDLEEWSGEDSPK